MTQFCMLAKCLAAAASHSFTLSFIGEGKTANRRNWFDTQGSLVDILVYLIADSTTSGLIRAATFFK